MQWGHDKFPTDVRVDGIKHGVEETLQNQDILVETQKRLLEEHEEAAKRVLLFFS